MSHLVEHGFTLIKQGAEAKLFSGMYLDRPTIVKERFSKSYRHPALDSSLNRERTRSEARSILKSLVCGVRTPAVYYVDHVNNRIYMEHVRDGVTVKDYLTGLGDKIDLSGKLDRLTSKIASAVSRLHENNIVHGDLTTSNMLLAPPGRTPSDGPFDPDEGEIVMIDFGLSRADSGAEDKAVDLYVLERALTSAHSELPSLFEGVLAGYSLKNKAASAEVLKKFEEVRLRGRKRTMVG